MYVNGVCCPPVVTKEELLELATTETYGLKKDWITDVKEDFQLKLELSDDNMIRYAERDGDKTICLIFWKGLMDDTINANFRVEHGKFRFSA